MKRTLIFDASAIFNFGHQGQLGHVLERFALQDQLIVTDGVLKEVVPEADFPYREFCARYFSIIPPEYLGISVGQLAEVRLRLNAGEVEAIATALSLRADIVLDERRARRHATNLGLNVTGTFGLLQSAIEKGWMDDAEALDAVARMIRNGSYARPLQAEATLKEYLAKL